MKIHLFILGLLFIYSMVHGQTPINETISASGINIIHFNFEYGNASISTYSGNEIQITGNVMINNGLNDDAFKIEQTKNGDEVSVRTFIPKIDKLPKVITVVKDGQKYIFNSESGNKKEIRQQIKETIGGDGYSMYSEGVQTDIQLEIKIPRSLKIDIQSTYGDITINDVSSPLKVENTYGHVEASFTNLAQLETITLKSTYDFVDISVPAGAAVSVDLDSDFGRIYTDLDLDIDTGRSRTKDFSCRIIGSVKSGGPVIKAKATYKNIYLRKRM